jgi:hypothetical protein
MSQNQNAGIVSAPSSGGAGAMNTFADNGGRILRNIHLFCIFWGNPWITPAGPITPTTPTIGNVLDAARRIVDSPYMSGLAQYRRIGRGKVSGTALVNSVVGSSLADPPNPFTDNDVSTLVENLIAGGLVADPNTITDPLYIVFVPTGVGQGGSTIGEHTFYTRGDGVRVPYAWVTNDGTLANLSIILSHEIVEACTDPEGSAFLGIAGTCSGSGWCEIGDICSNSGDVNGVTVQEYYSNREGRCIIPDAAYEKSHTKEHKDKDKDKDKESQKENKDGAKEKDNTKDVKDKDTKDIKDKDTKDVKDKDKEKDKENQKENKDGAKDKENRKENKDGAKEKDRDDFNSISLAISELGAHVSELNQRLANLSGGTGEAFIKPIERPDVGGYVYKEK